MWWIKLTVRWISEWEKIEAKVAGRKFMDM
jgi:hypothetical protein